MVLDYRKYALFNYEQAKESENDKYILGHVVIKKSDSEIGVVIQRHGNNEYRTDMFGNCCESEIRLATDEEIKTFRKELVSNCRF
jgi:hypothetical protein